MSERKAARSGRWYHGAMGPKAVWWACACVGLAAWWPASLRADAFHHQPIPLGERALGMGGAFTGVANEPSAAYYNPAGLARLEDTTLSAGLTLSAFNRLTIDKGYRTSAGSAELRHDSSPSLPLFVSFVKQVGVRDVEERRRHAVALSTFTVDQRQLSFDVKIQNSDVAGRSVIDTLYVNHEESTRWQGASYAYRISDALSIGISTFLSLSHMSHAEERLNLTLGDANADGTSQRPTVRLDSRRASSTVTNLVARIGLLYVRPRVRLGLMIQPPSGRVKGVSTVRDRAVTANALTVDPYGTYSEESRNKLRSQEPSPFELRLGTSYEPTSDLTLAFDGSFYGGTGDRKDPVIAIGPRPIDSATGRTARAGDLVVETWYRMMTANVSLGAEYTIWDALVVRAGVYTDLSAAPSLPRTSLAYRPADIDRFGAALSLGVVTRGYDVSIGGVGRFGFGHALAFAVDTGGAPYVRTSAREHTLYIFLTGARRAVSRLAKETVDKLREVRAAEAAETAASAPGTVPEEPPAPAKEPSPNEAPEKGKKRER